MTQMKTTEFQMKQQYHSTFICDERYEHRWVSDTAMSFRPVKE